MSVSKASRGAGSSKSSRPNSASKRRPPSSLHDSTSIHIKTEGPGDEEQEGILAKKRFQDIEDRRLKEWDDHQRAQRSRSNVEVTNPKVFLDFTVGEMPVGRVIVELLEDVVPETASNFRKLVMGENHYDLDTGVKLDYVDSPVHKIVPGLALYMGDLGCLNLSAEGGPLKDENFAVRHTSKGLLSMVSSGPNTSGSSFCITLDRAPSLDFKQVVFGKIVEQQSLSVLDRLEQCSILHTGTPKQPISISFCGALSGGRRPEGVHIALDQWRKQVLGESSEGEVEEVPAAAETGADGAVQDEDESKDDDDEPRKGEEGLHVEDDGEDRVTPIRSLGEAGEQADDASTSVRKDSLPDHPFTITTQGPGEDSLPTPQE